jgi:hypothetical protein
LLLVSSLLPVIAAADRDDYADGFTVLSATLQHPEDQIVLSAGRDSGATEGTRRPHLLSFDLVAPQSGPLTNASVARPLFTHLCLWL